MNYCVPLNGKEFDDESNVIEEFLELNCRVESPWQPDVRPIKKRLYETFHDVVYNIDCIYSFLGKEKHCTVNFIAKAGYITDLQSTPPIVWLLCKMLPDGPVRKAALLHDILYHTKGGLIDRPLCNVLVCGSNSVLSRKACDQIYRSVYIDSAPFETKHAKKGYAALRMFGWMFWGRETPPAGRK